MADFQTEFIAVALSQTKKFNLTVGAKRRAAHDNARVIRSCSYPAMGIHIHHLPVEILNLIFEMACDRNFFSSAYQKSEVSTLVLSSVCSYWRAIIFDAPQLWADISLNLNTTEDGWDRIIPPVLRYLKQSKQYPLSLDIEMWIGEEGEHDLMDVLIGQSHRWRNLRISTGSLALISYPSLSAIQYLPLLEDLQIIHSIGSDATPELNIFKAAPRLYSLTLNAFLDSNNKDLEYITSRVGEFPWGQIRHLKLDIGPRGLAGITDTVEWCSQLVSLTYVNLEQYDLMGPSPVAPQTSALRSLCIELCDNWAITKRRGLYQLLSSLTLPSLTSLTIKFGPRLSSIDREWPEQAFTSFITRSRCSLISLRLERIILTPRAAIRSLELLPTLLELTIHEQERTTYDSEIITSFFLRSLCVQRDAEYAGEKRISKTLLPRLETLDLAVHAKSFDAAAYVKMITSRCGSGEPSQQAASSSLRSIRLRVMHHEIPRGIYNELLGFRKMGLNVVLSGPNLCYDDFLSGVRHLY